MNDTSQLKREEDRTTASEDDELTEEELGSEHSFDETQDDTSEDNGEGVSVEPNTWSIIWSFLKQLHFGADLTRISVPSALCLPSSFLQTLAMKCMRGAEILPRLAQTDDPLARMLLVIQFYLSILTKEEFAKKPLNPILGESFQCREPKTGCYFVAEQVSHHPPLTAFYMCEKKTGVYLTGNIQLSAQLATNSIGVKTEGTARLVVNHREVYVLSPQIPPLRARGILIGRKRNELYGNVRLVCAATGFEAVLRFNPKGDMVTGTLYHARKRVTSLQGSWLDKVMLESRCSRTYVKSGLYPQAVIDLFDGGVLFDASKVKEPIIEKIVEERQGGKDSDSVWNKTIVAIRKRQFDKADEEKRKVEQQQRLEAKDKNPKMYQGIFFVHNEKSGVWEYASEPK